MQTVRLKPRIGLLQQVSHTINVYLPLTCSRYPPPPPPQPQRRWASSSHEPHDERSGTTTPVPEGSTTKNSKSPFYFEAGYAVFAKRRSRPFPPPFVSTPSASFSDPLSTHNQSRDRRPPEVNGQLIRGVTNGDDAVLVNENFVIANDGVGAWAQKEKGHAALWSRLIIHFWALEAEKDSYGGKNDPNPVAYLQRAYEQTKKATSEPNEWFGTTTASGALLADDHQSPPHPIIYATQLGDSQIMIVRPRDREIIYKTQEQWHWFDCPRQLGTNSPDTPETNAVMDRVEIEENDVVLAMSDGVIDNLWDHEVLQSVVDAMHKWENGEAAIQQEKEPAETSYSHEMMFVAEEVVKAAKAIATDPFAESPYMEKAVEEGLSVEGGKMDDISVVAAQSVIFAQARNNELQDNTSQLLSDIGSAVLFVFTTVVPVLVSLVSLARPRPVFGGTGGGAVAAAGRPRPRTDPVATAVCLAAVRPAGRVFSAGATKFVIDPGFTGETGRARYDFPGESGFPGESRLNGDCGSWRELCDFGESTFEGLRRDAVRTAHTGSPV
ncbi:hypothetical protein E6O75_ATG09729 [Venturia nashicola]|uniref:Protein phosphatase n=1 Tax=Venturia nashicola TaxID=86259 RepID=A0A4Z1NMN2_9PEZI|nr:hypothetical protein E6O75_ATG09729 [Venturia nashicola]